jgi:hypothetical protein
LLLNPTLALGRPVAGHESDIDSDQICSCPTAR